jgi:hypothetical protein
MQICSTPLLLVPPKNCLEPINASFSIPPTQKLLKLFCSSDACMETLFLYSFSSVHVLVRIRGSVDSNSVFRTVFWALDLKCGARFSHIKVGLPFDTKLECLFLCNACDYFRNAYHIIPRHINMSCLSKEISRYPRRYSC